VNKPDQPAPSPVDLVADFRCPIFGAYGELDTAIPLGSVEHFRGAVEAPRKIAEIHIMPGASHAFMNQRPECYLESDAAAS
jgi:dienelactone hydrolase